MKFNRFEDILAWQKALELTEEIYKLLAESKDYSFKDQIQRASTSIKNELILTFYNVAPTELFTKKN